MQQKISKRYRSTLEDFVHTSFLEKEEEQTSKKKYRVMFFFLIENHMQRFRHFWRKKKNRHKIVT